MRQAGWRNLKIAMMCVGLVWASSAVAAVPSEQLMPDTTKGYVSVTNFEKLKAQWNKTQLGQLMKDPVMEPFTADLQRQFEDRLSDIHDRLGLTIEDLRGVPSGEVALAMTQPAADHVAVVLTVDVGSNTDKAKAMLQKIGQNLLRRKAKEGKIEVAGITARTFLVPRKEDDRELQPMAFFLDGGLMVAADDFEVMKGVMARAKGKKEGSLATVPAYQGVIARLQKDAGAQKPEIRWYVEPLGYMEALRIATPEGKRRKGRTIIQMVRSVGFDALKGMGGYVSFKDGKYELLHRTAILAPAPFQKSMKMMVFPNKAEFTPQRWIPRDVATYVTFYIDILNAFDNFGPLFDEVAGEGQPGTWDDVLKSLKMDPSGPKIDLRKELIGYLGQRITVLADYQLPIKTDSERMLYAIEIKDEKAVAAAIEKWMGGDPATKKRDFKGKLIWEIVEEKTPDMQPPVVEGIQPPTPGGVPPIDVPPTPKEERLLPHAAVTVGHGHLLIATHIDFLIKVLPLVEERKMLARDPDYQRVRKELDQLAIKENCTLSFSRTDEEMRTTYELIKAGKMPESETTLGRVLNAVLGPNKRGEVRKQKIDGSRLPDYQVVRRYLGSAGLLVTSEKEGWFVKGFLLPKESKPAPMKAGAKPAESKPVTPKPAAPKPAATKPAEPKATPPKAK